MSSKSQELLESGLTDRTLLSRFRSGEDNAASELYLRYAKRLHHLASRQTSNELSYRIPSEEIVQSVFRTFFRRVSKGQYDAAEGDDLWRLFLVIALNKIRSAAEFHGAKKRDFRKSESVAPETLDSLLASVGQEEIAFNVLKLTVDELLSELQLGHSQIVRLRIEGYSVPEIAKETGRSQRTTERVLQEFRVALMKIIEA